MSRGSILSKLFSTEQSDAEDFITSNSAPAIKELMKLLVMGDICRSTVSHWVDNLAGIINSCNKKKAHNIQVFLGVVSNYKNLPRRVSQTRIEKEVRKGKTVEEYIDLIYDSIENDRRGGENKYGSVLRILRKNGELPDTQTLIQKIKYVALCITGQLKAENDEWYDSKVQTMVVDWEWSGEVDRDDLLKIIEKII